MSPSPAKFNPGRRRAWVLALVQVVLLAHILWWYTSGEAIAPLEPSEGMAFAQRGEVNPGLVLFALAALATMVFGRFFCGWGCHLLALQDGARWLMLRLGIRPRPFKARLLRVVPIAAFVYMFLWPFLVRLWLGEPQPGITEFRWTTHAFWATFPGPVVSTLTILLGGAGVIYLLGSKAYCSYACPYGALFGAADALAPGRIRVNDDCQQCAKCTAACSSDVRVHEEVRDFGTVMDAGCMKCLDCVSVCPNDALSFSFGKPAMFTSARAEGRRSRIGIPNWGEELILAGGYALGFFASYRLYGAVPLLLALALGMVGAWATWTTYQMLRQPAVRFQGQVLKLNRRWSKGGIAAVLLSLAFFVAAGHSLMVRQHESSRDHHWQQFAGSRNVILMEGLPQVLPPELLSAATKAAEEAHWLEEHGIFPQALNHYAIAWKALLEEDLEGFEAGVGKVLELRPGFGEVLFQVGHYYRALGKDLDALAYWERVPSRDARFLDASLARVQMLKLMIQPEDARAILQDLRDRGYEEEQFAGVSVD